MLLMFFSTIPYPKLQHKPKLLNISKVIQLIFVSYKQTKLYFPCIKDFCFQTFVTSQISPHTLYFYYSQVTMDLNLFYLFCNSNLFFSFFKTSFCLIFYFLPFLPNTSIHIGIHLQHRRYHLCVNGKINE